MANTTILNLPVAVALDGSEYFPLVQGGTTKRAQSGLLMGGSGEGSVEDANTFLAGPESGAAAAPTYRNIVQADLPAGSREGLTANRTYYVRTDGSNSNDGLANTAAGAFLTIQYALDVTYDTLDLNEFDVTIQVADGTYGPSARSGPRVGSGFITVVGNTSTPSNVVVDAPGDTAFLMSYGASISVSSLKVQGGSGLYAFGPEAEIFYDAVVFGVCTSGHITSQIRGWVGCQGSYSIVGGATYHMAAYGGTIRIPTGMTVTLTGTPAFSSVFAEAVGNGLIILLGVTWSGSATGQRFSVRHQSHIFFDGPASLTALPGNSAGYIESGSQYGILTGVGGQDAVNDAVTQGLRLVHTTSGTPSAGIGAGMEFQVETSANNNEIGATIEAVANVVTAAAEDFYFNFKLMGDGAAATQRMLISADGTITGLILGPGTGGDGFTFGAVEGTTGSEFYISRFPGTNAGSDPDLYFVRSRGTTIGAHTIVADGDSLGTIHWQGSNGTTGDNAAQITGQVDGTPGASNDMPGRLLFLTSSDGSATPAEHMRITAAGQTILSTSGTVSIDVESGTAPRLQVHGGSFETAAQAIYRWQASSTGAAKLYFAKSRGAIPTHTILNDGDDIGQIFFQGSDGSAFQTAAQILAEVDGSPAAGDMPGRLTFWTTLDGTTTPVERLRINNAGCIIALSATTTPPTLATNGQWVMTPTSNTNMRISYRGSDGATKTADITLS